MGEERAQRSEIYVRNLLLLTNKIQENVFRRRRDKNKDTREKLVK